MEEVAANAGFTHKGIISHLTLVQSVANTAETVKLFRAIAGQIIQKMEVRLAVPFEDTADPAYDTTTLIIGDAGSTNRFITSQELNRNGTEIVIPAFNNTAYQYTADTDVNAIFGSKAGKSISNLNKGEVHIFVQILDVTLISRL